MLQFILAFYSYAFGNMLKLIRYSPETCFKLNQNVISNSVRLFNYDNWYKGKSVFV